MVLGLACARLGHRPPGALRSRCHSLSFYDETVRHVGNPQGPLLLVLTGPLGIVAGVFFGLWMAIKDTRQRCRSAKPQTRAAARQSAG